MILFQIARWMEERGRLLISIRDRSGDVPRLLERKRQIEQHLLEGAREWGDGRLHSLGLPEPVFTPLAARELPSPDREEDIPLRHLPAFMLDDAASQLGAQAETYTSST